MNYKVTNIVYATDGLKVDLPTELILEADSKDELADRISDKTGWLVESFTIKKHSEFCLELLNQVKEQVKSAIIEILTEHKVESINLNAYFEEHFFTGYSFYDEGEEGLSLDSVKMVNGQPIFTMYNLRYDEIWGEKVLDDFNATELENILEILEEIFELVDNEGEPLLKEGEDYSDYEEE